MTLKMKDHVVDVEGEEVCRHLSAMQWMYVINGLDKRTRNDKSSQEEYC